jgi:hypothetical protein
LKKNLPLVLTLLSKYQNKWEIFSNLVAFSENLNFTYSLKFNLPKFRSGPITFFLLGCNLIHYTEIDLFSSFI